MADMLHDREVLSQDFTDAEAVDFGLSNTTTFDRHFIDPKGRTERVAVFGSPGDHFPAVTATEPTLVWLVRWL